MGEKTTKMGTEGEMDAKGIVLALMVILIVAGVILAVWAITDDGGVSWEVKNLRVEDAGWWASVTGTLINTGTEDASWVEVRVWVKVGGLKYYDDVYVGDIPAGGAEDFWTLVDCDPTDYMTCGVDKVTWSDW